MACSGVDDPGSSAAVAVDGAAEPVGNEDACLGVDFEADRRGRGAWCEGHAVTGVEVDAVDRPVGHGAGEGVAVPVERRRVDAFRLEAGRELVGGRWCCGRRFCGVGRCAGSGASAQGEGEHSDAGHGTSASGDGGEKHGGSFPRSAVVEVRCGGVAGQGQSAVGVTVRWSVMAACRSSTRWARRMAWSKSGAVVVPERMSSRTAV